MNEIKEKEETLKQEAVKQGYTLLKSAKGYMIVDFYTGRIIEGHDYSFTQEEVKRFLAE